MDEALAKLEADFCPPLDPALLSAIVSDYDLDTEEGLSAVRQTLEALKESADIEGAEGFDPSGSGGQEIGEIVEESQRHCSERGTGESVSRETDLTSLSNGLAALETQDAEVGTTEDLEKLDEDTKVLLLQDLFGDHVSRYSIQHTLRKANGKWISAMEELLNHVYFGEAEDSEDGSRTPSKGIDAFSEDNVGRRGRKGKAKGRKFKSLDDRRGMSSPEDSASPAPNKWQTATEEVNFVATRTGIEVATVKSTYNEQCGSLPQTINALLKQTAPETKKIVTDDSTVAAHARELGQAFPTVSPDYLAAIIRLTHPSTTDAHNLATALIAKPKPQTQTGIRVVPQYARPGLQDLDPEAFTPKPSRSAASSRSPADPSRTSAYALARAQAFTQASAAHRKAKSDRLMGGAAAYYAQVGRDYSALSASANAAAADALASQQSSATHLDLHGVDVLNGCRIAQQKVAAWWSGLGESRVNGRVGAGERGEGYRIVVGLGRHSEGGKGKLGPAVTKALRGDGWRVEQTGAVIVVMGKAKR